MSAMKNPMMRLSQFLIVSCFSSCILVSCTSKKSESEQVTQVPAQTIASVDYEVSEDKAALAQYYKLDHIKEWYPERILPPVFDYTLDLSNKSIVDLWLLRNEIFARNGYLFEDAVLRGYFNQFKWYQPIFDVPEFKAQLNKQEQEFVDKILKRENELAGSRYSKMGGYKMINMDHVYNLIQFKAIDENLKASLTKNNFTIAPAKHEQLFHVYDNNHYEYIPNFITTDIYLQVLHKHFSTVFQKVEEDKFIPLLTELLRSLYNESNQYSQSINDPRLQTAAKFSTTYLGIAYSLITNKIQSTDPILKQEFSKIISAQGNGSEFLKSDIISYSQFKPRGNYTKSQELENYFRCVKWLNTAPIIIEEDERLLSAVLIASSIKKSPDNLKVFERYNEAIKFIVGEEDNLSIGTLVKTLSVAEANNPNTFNDAVKLQSVRGKLGDANVDRIKPKGGEATISEKLSQKTILFTAGRYTFDAEILSRLIHVLRPEPKRTFPKGLDVFASLGSESAKNILLNEYGEQKKWSGFADTLNTLRGQFSKFNQWDQNIYTKTFETISNLNNEDSNYPLFMKTPAWSKKSLSTSLAAWTELKHDMLLYSEQPYAAQAGEGGGPPPPLHVSYVEPNVAFWEKALELLEFQEKQLTSMDLMNEDTRRIIVDLKEIGNLLLTVSKKELANEKITTEEFNYLSYLGGRIEYLTFRIFGSDHLPEKERLVAVVADVYNYNGEYLEEALGMIDEIYVVAEINGKPYLTKGAVFSYYEFTSKTPLSDEDWRIQITSGKAPDRPVWLKEIMVNTPTLESKPSYSF
jgi:hypothetical protein